MIDDDIFKLAFKHCYAPTAAGGFIFTRNSMINFARALLAASAPTPSDKQEAVAEIVRYETFTGRTAWDIKIRDTSLKNGALLYAAPLAQSAEQDRIDAERYRRAREADYIVDSTERAIDNWIKGASK